MNIFKLVLSILLLTQSLTLATSQYGVPSNALEIQSKDGVTFNEYLKTTQGNFTDGAGRIIDGYKSTHTVLKNDIELFAVVTRLNEEIDIPSLSVGATFYGSAKGSWHAQMVSPNESFEEISTENVKFIQTAPNTTLRVQYRHMEYEQQTIVANENNNPIYSFIVKSTETYGSSDSTTPLVNASYDGVPLTAETSFHFIEIYTSENNELSKHKYQYDFSLENSTEALYKTTELLYINSDGNTEKTGLRLTYIPTTEKITIEKI